jgi:hypothetical protein
MVAGALLLAGAPAEARQRVVGKYRIDFTAQIRNDGKVHSSDPNGSFDGSVSFSGDAHWFALVTLRNGFPPGDRPGKEPIEYTNARFRGGASEYFQNFVPGQTGPGYGTTVTGQAQWSGTYTSKPPYYTDAVTASFSCSYLLKDHALGNLVRVTYKGPYSGKEKLGDGRTYDVPVSIRVADSAGGESSDPNRIRAHCQSSDPRDTDPDQLAPTGSSLGTMLADKKGRDVLFRMPRLLAAMRHGGSVTARSTEPSVSDQGPFPRFDDEFQPGKAHMVVTAKLSRAH